MKFKHVPTKYLVLIGFGLFFMFLFVSFSSALQLTVGADWSAAASMDDRYGVICTALEDITIVNVTVSAGDNSEYCRITNTSNHAELGSASLSSQFCTPDINVSQGIQFRVFSDPDNSDNDGGQNDDTPSGGYPLSNDHINCTSGTYDIAPYDNAWTDSASYAWAIQYIGTKLSNETPPPSGDTPSLTLTTNLTTGLYPNDISFNVTGSALNTTVNLWNCTSYLNASSNETALNVPINQTFQVFNLTYGNLELGYDVNVTCERWDYSLHVQGSVLVTDVFIDTVFPSLDIDTDFTNNTVYYRGINYLNFTTTYNDTNLFATNLSIFRLNLTDGINLTINNTYQDTINATGYTQNYTGDRTIDVGNDVNWLTGKYMIRGEAWDDHTTNKVKPLKIDYLADGILFDDEIKIYGSQIKSSLAWLDETKEDRYKFKFKFYEDSLLHSFYIETTEELVYRPASGYFGHFVYMPLERWIDLQNPNINGVVVSQQAPNKYYVSVVLKNIDDEIEFESIGDLNYESKEWFLNVSNGFTFQAVDGITNSSISNFTIEVWDGATILWNSSTTTGNLTINITSGGYTTNATNEDYVVNSTNITYSLAGNYIWNLLAANSLYLIIYDEQTNTMITDRNVTIDVINYQNDSTTYTTDTGSTFQSGFSAGEYEINYKADNYTLRSYYTTIEGSDTQSIDLYLLLTAEGNYNSYDVVDDSAGALVNVTVSMQRYFITDNAWKTVEMSKSNEAGGGFLFVELYDAPYRFMLEYLGIVEKISDQMKLDARDLYFKLTLLDSGIEGFFDAGGVTVGLTFDNDTDVFTFTYVPVDVDVDSGSIYVEHSTVYLTDVICNSTLEASTGGITCNISAYNGEDGSFTAFGYLDMGADDQEQLVATMSYSYSTRYMTFGLNGLFLAFLVIGTMAMVALWSPSVAIAMSLLGLFLVVQIGLIYVTTTWLVGTIVVGVIFIAHIKV